MKKRNTKRSTPKNLVQAIEQNWQVVEQLSTWRFKGVAAREGFFRLRKKGCRETLMVRYRALYDLGEPYFS